VSVRWKWTLLLTAVFLAFIAGQCGWGFYKGIRYADEAARRFHGQFNGSEYLQVYRQADDAFRRLGSEEQFLKFFGDLHTKLGDAGPRVRTRLQVAVTSKGPLVIATYKTTFAHAPAVERFTWRGTRRGLVLHAYNVFVTE